MSIQVSQKNAVLNRKAPEIADQGNTEKLTLDLFKNRKVVSSK